MAEASPPPPPEPRVRLGRRYAVTLAASLAGWVTLVGTLVYLIYARTTWLGQADAANLREWIDESRVYRKTLPDLAGDYLALRDRDLPAEDPDVVGKAGEIATQMQVMTGTPRMLQSYLPLFPDIYRLEMRFPGTDWPPIAWKSPVLPPRQQNQTRVDVLEYPLAQYGGRAVLRCEYRLHAFNQRQREAADRHQMQLLAMVIGAAAVL